MIILTLDTGTYKTGYCLFDTQTYTVLEMGDVENKNIFLLIESYIVGNPVMYSNRIILEDITNLGKNNSTIIETCKWLGRFDYHISRFNSSFEYMTRGTVVKNMRKYLPKGFKGRLKDPQIRQAVINRLHPQFKIGKDEGCLKGMRGYDTVSAIALAITWSDLNVKKS